MNEQRYGTQYADELDDEPRKVTWVEMLGWIVAAFAMGFTLTVLAVQ